MKKLHLIRHAKSSWSSGALADIERPLNQRGVRACALMAEKIVQAGCTFEHVFCSPAVRAESTIENLAAALNRVPLGESVDGKASPKEDHTITWKIDPDLYTFVVKDLLIWAQQVDNALSDVVIIGHNSALTDFVNTVTNQQLDNIPTCGYVQLAVQIENWQALSPGTGEIISFLKPKMFTSKESSQ